MTDTIPVVVATDTSSPQTLGLGSSVQERIEKIDAEVLRQSIGKLTGQLNSLFEDVQNVGNFELNSVQISLEISAEGGVALIGSAKAGAKGALSLTFSPKS